uniref:EF-hand domain-containing protein n=1 Tax=Guillardia theta TaxID=55529 RepID=A0A7S4K9S0_GUITH|mmetsp:Transcript_22064/g.72684  ORF Transcript_22064/g.72684 Transcript_22064/m.72684 type:complete len:373 (+) Transcript_22064:202-1320(+)
MLHASKRRLMAGRWMTDVEYQGVTNSCCANAVAGAYEYLCKRQAEKTGDTVGDISRLFIYYVGRLADAAMFNEEHLPLEDGGMTVDGAIKALQSKGACLEKNWDFDEGKVNHKPHDHCFEEALRYKIRDAMKVPLDLQTMKTCLSDGFPIVFGLRLTESFLKPAKNGYVPKPDSSDPEASEHGTHALLLVGYSDPDQCFIVRNSWGSTWADGGYCYVAYDYVCNPDYNLVEYVGQWAIRGLDDYDFTPEDGVPNQEHIVDRSKGDEQEKPQIEVREKEMHPVEGGQESGDLFDIIAEARRVFKAIDTDGSGFIELGELKTAYRLQGVYITDAQLKAVLKIYDTSGDGKIDFDEYCVMVGIKDKAGNIIQALT